VNVAHAAAAVDQDRRPDAYPPHLFV
jgi:hypothetical protein